MEALKHQPGTLDRLLLKKNSNQIITFVRRRSQFYAIKRIYNLKSIINLTYQFVVGFYMGIKKNCILNCGGAIEIGKNVLIGPNVVIYSQNHNFSDKSKPIKDQGYSYSKVVNEYNVWIGSGTTILPGSYIEKGSVIGASSVFGGKAGKYGIYYGDKAKRRNHY